ncbi:MAG: LysR family transcriptional regulator [Frankiaceae bacterium]
MTIATMQGALVAAAPAQRGVADLGLTRLRAFVCLADELHFGRAARRLHITQPALSQQISRLEKEVATPLLRRTHREVSLTPAGRHFLKGARAALAILESSVAAARRHQGEPEPLVLSHVTGPRTEADAFVVALCRALEARLLLTRVLPVRHSVEEHVEALREGSAYLGLCPDAESVPVHGLDWTVIAPPAATTPLRLSWPSWASLVEAERLVLLAQQLMLSRSA